jgi:DNA-binding CsgD family transcriptional regulator
MANVIELQLIELTALMQRQVELTEKLIEQNKTIIGQFETTPTAMGVSTDEADLLRNMTAKMHVALQLILAGANTTTIAERLEVKPSTAKVHVRGVAKRLGVKTRTQITSAMLPVMQRIDPASYEKLSGGLPKDWGERMMAGERDDWRSIYMDD